MAAMFSWIDLVKTQGVLTAGSQVSTLPAQNLADRKVQKVWRSVTPAGDWFGVDFGAPVAISVLGLFGCNLASADTVRHRLSTVSLGAGDVLDTTAVACNVQSRYAQHLYLPTSPPLSARYWRCDIVATSRVASGTFDIGRAWAGDVWQPSVNQDYGWGQNWQDDSSVAKSPRSGVVFEQDGAIYRRRSFTFSALTDADMAQAMNMDYDCGTRGQLLFIPDSAGSPNSEAILGRQVAGAGGGQSAGNVAAQIIQIPQITNPTDASPARYTRTYTIEQDL